MEPNALIEDINALSAKSDEISAEFKRLSPLVRGLKANSLDLSIANYLLLTTAGLEDALETLNGKFTKLIDDAEVFGVLIDNKNYIERLCKQYRQEDRGADEVLCFFSEFKKLLSIGTITFLEGTVIFGATKKDKPPARRFQKEGDTKPLFLNSDKKVRPPVGVMIDEDFLVITDIEIQEKNGKVLHQKELQALISTLV